MLPPGNLFGDLLGGEDTGVRAADDVEGGALDLGPESGRSVVHDRHAVLAIHPADHRRQDADVRHRAGQHQVGDAAGAERRVERGAVEAVVVVLGYDELSGLRGELGHEVDVGLAHEARRRRPAEAARGTRSGPAMLGVEEADEYRDVFRVGVLGEDHGEAFASEEVEEQLDLRNDVPGGRNFHRLARIEEGALHVDDDERGPARLKPQRLFKRVRSVHVGPCCQLPGGDRKGVRDVPYGFDAAVVVNNHGYDVEAAGLLTQALGPEIALRELAELVLLARVHAGLRRWRILDVPPRLDLDEDQRLALFRDEIDLARARPDVLLEDRVPAACQEAGRLVLAFDACDLPRVDRHGSLLARYDGKQVLLENHPVERPPVQGTGAVHHERRHVLERGVALVTAEAVLWVLAIRFRHDPVPRHLGDNRCGGHRGRPLVSPDQVALRALQPAQLHEIRQHQLGLEPENAQRQAHGPPRGLEYVHTINRRRVDHADADRDRARPYDRVQLLPFFRRQQLRVVDASDPRARPKHHRRRHHRPRQGAAPGLIEPRDAREPAPPGRLLVAIRSARGRSPPLFRRRLAGGRHLDEALLLQTRRLAREIPQVVELRAPHGGPLHHLDLVDPRGVQRERPLHAHPVGDAPHGERGADSVAALADHHALEDLDPLLLALDHLDRYADRVAGRDARPVLLQLPRFDDANGLHDSWLLTRDSPRAAGPR